MAITFFLGEVDISPDGDDLAWYYCLLLVCVHQSGDESTTARGHDF